MPRPINKNPSPTQNEQAAQPPVDGAAQPRPSSRMHLMLKRVGLALLLMIALILAYLFLLLGEPDDDSKFLPDPVEESISMPMSALEIPGQANLETVVQAFGQPVLSLGQAPAVAMRKARIYDTAFEGGYARRVTLTCAFEDGTLFTVESLRPTSAVTLLRQEGGTLDGSSLYTLGGLNAARMENASTVCVFAQDATAVYAVLCPRTHAEELSSLLRHTMLALPEMDS